MQPEVADVRSLENSPPCRLRFDEVTSLADAREDELAFRRCVSSLEDPHRHRHKYDAQFFTVLRLLGWHRPRCTVPVDLRPRHRLYVAAPCSGKQRDQEEVADDPIRLNRHRFEE